MSRKEYIENIAIQLQLPTEYYFDNIILFVKPLRLSFSFRFIRLSFFVDDVIMIIINTSSIDSVLQNEYLCGQFTKLDMYELFGTQEHLHHARLAKFGRDDLICLQPTTRDKMISKAMMLFGAM